MDNLLNARFPRIIAAYGRSFVMQVLLERWTISHSRQTGTTDVGTDINVHTMKSYKHITVLLRTLFSFCRIVPSFQHFTRAKQARGASMDQIDFTLYTRGNAEEQAGGGCWKHVPIQRPGGANLNHMLDPTKRLVQQSGADVPSTNHPVLAFDDTVKTAIFHLSRTSTPIGELCVDVQYRDDMINKGLVMGAPPSERAGALGDGMLREYHGIANAPSIHGQGQRCMVPMQQTETETAVRAGHGEGASTSLPRSGLGVLLDSDNATRIHRDTYDEYAETIWHGVADEVQALDEGVLAASNAGRRGAFRTASEPVFIPSSNCVVSIGSGSLGAAPRLYSCSEGCARPLVPPAHYRRFFAEDKPIHHNVPSPLHLSSSSSSATSPCRVSDGTSSIEERFSRIGLPLAERPQHTHFVHPRRRSYEVASDTSTTPPFLSASPGSLSSTFSAKYGISCSPPFSRTNLQATNLLSVSPQQTFMDSRPFHAASMASSSALTPTNGVPRHAGRSRSSIDGVRSVTPPNKIQGILSSELQELPESPFLARHRRSVDESSSMKETRDSMRLSFEARQQQEQGQQREVVFLDGLDTDLPFACQGDGLLEGGVGSDLAMSTDANRNGIASAVGPSYRASPGLEPPLEVSSFVHLIESAPQLSLFSSTRGIASNMPGVPRSSNSSGSGTMPSLSIEDELADAVTFGEMLRAATTAQGESSSAGEDGSR